MIKRVFTAIMILAVLALSVSAADLKDFPGLFIEDDSVNAVIVLGRAAKAEDVIGAIDIVAMLQNELGGKKIEIARLDNEVVGNLADYNTIMVGGPCANAASAKLLGYPKNCLEGFEVGKGYVKLYQWSNGNLAMMVAGTVALDTRRATTVMSNYADYNLTGNSLIISGISMKELTVKRVD